MAILKSIGAFFVRIWRWIKETAWVQPLLIVGAIFAVIFSIPYITTWVQGWTGSTQYSFYQARLQTLEGQMIDPTPGQETEADKFANVLEANERVIRQAVADGTYSSLTTEDFDTSYGEKFFFVVWQEDCSACETAEDALRYLDEHWGEYNLRPAISGETFLMHTIDASQESSNDDDDAFLEMGTAPSAFNRWTLQHVDLFQQLSTDWDWQNSAYKVNESIGDDNYLKFFIETSDSADPTEALGSFPVPSIVLVDYTDEAVARNLAGIREVIFSVTGDTTQNQAALLMNMWNHTETPTMTNPFTNYRNY